MNILLVTTSHSELGDTGHRTGVWLEELAAPYYVFKDAGANITIASPKGGQVPLDPSSEKQDATTEATERFTKDVEALSLLASSKPLSEVKATDFDLVFLPGGHGPMWDLPENPELKKLLEGFNRAGKPIGSVCHGVAGLVGIKNTNGEPLVSGKKVTSFTNTEEELVGLTTVVPFLLESVLREQGAIYSKEGDFEPYVVTDGNIVTGQNPASSAPAAHKILSLITSK